ncbi:DUF6320 domain-containing protein [Tessaracoccus oleiagri]|uniref:DUF6320 domain-containing protein n=1 Tax=Tessaracoccus oleiagri TaxID=686624 RepID=UPI000B882425|nr:DUF6320 domain-containing protein [Tessaracoccus oleiagri]
MRLEAGPDEATGTPEVFPPVPLRFDRRQLWAAVVALSVLVVVASFAAQSLVPDLVAPVRTVWLSVAVVWLVVVAAVQRRRNVGSLVGWLVVLLSLAAVAWNAIDGPAYWATTWVIPAICTTANLALGVVVWIIRQDPTEHLAKAVLVALFGLAPGLFVLFGWVVTPVPALVCVGFSVLVLVLMVAIRPRQLGAALHRRLHI